MNIRSLILITALLLISAGASCLTMKQFSDICRSANGECSDHPTLQAYVGGALDLVAVLDEETDYLAEVYCKEPAELFAVPTIIQFMLEHREGYENRNAMVLVVRYLEVNGGC